MDFRLGVTTNTTQFISNNTADDAPLHNEPYDPKKGVNITTALIPQPGVVYGLRATQPPYKGRGVTEPLRIAISNGGNEVVINDYNKSVRGQGLPPGGVAGTYKGAPAIRIPAPGGNGSLVIQINTGGGFSIYSNPTGFTPRP